MKHTLVLMLSLPLIYGQTQVDLRTQSKGIDLTGATATKPFKAGTSLPATCGVGELFFSKTAPSGANLYACTAANTWTLQGGGALATGSGSPSTACSVGGLFAIGEFYYDTANNNIWLCESTGTWEKVLATTNTGSFLLTGQNGTTPATPVTGSTQMFFSSTAKTAQTVDDGGNLATMIRPMDCSAAGQFAQTIDATGTITCAGTTSTVSETFPGGSGSSASPVLGPWWQSGGTTAVCSSAAPYLCTLHWNSGTSLIAVTTKVPHNWVSGAVSVILEYQGSGSGNTVQPAVSSGCLPNGSSTVAFNTAQNFPSQVTVGTNYYSGTVASLTMTGCSADSQLVLQFSRVDTAGYMNVASASIVFNVP